MMTKLLWVMAAGVTTCISVFAQTTGGNKAELYAAMIARSGIYQLLSEQGNVAQLNCPKEYEFFPTFQVVDSVRAEMLVEPVFAEPLKCELTKERPFERKVTRDLVFGTTSDGRAYMNTSCKTKVRGTYREKLGYDTVWVGKIIYQEEVTFEMNPNEMTVTFMKNGWRVYYPDDYTIQGRAGVRFERDRYREQKVCLYRK